MKFSCSETNPLPEPEPPRYHDSAHGNIFSFAAAVAHAFVMSSVPAWPRACGPPARIPKVYTQMSDRSYGSCIALSPCSDCRVDSPVVHRLSTSMSDCLHFQKRCEIRHPGRATVGNLRSKLRALTPSPPSYGNALSSAVHPQAS